MTEQAPPKKPSYARPVTGLAGSCALHGRKPPEVVLHIDHVEAFSSGGLTKLDNLRTACSDCNLGKGATRL